MCISVIIFVDVLCGGYVLIFGLISIIIKDIKEFGEVYEMPKFDSKHPYKKMLEDANHLVTSQSVSEIYLKIKQEGQLNKFLALVQYCSGQGLDLAQSVDLILSRMSGYINRRKFSAETFAYMINNHHDVADAWFWGDGDVTDGVTNIMIKKKALKLVLSDDATMQDIKTYHELYNNKNSVSDNTTTISFNLHKDG